MNFNELDRSKNYPMIYFQNWKMHSEDTNLIWLTDDEGLVTQNRNESRQKGHIF